MCDSFFSYFLYRHNSQSRFSDRSIGDDINLQSGESRREEIGGIIVRILFNRSPSSPTNRRGMQLLFASVIPRGFYERYAQAAETSRPLVVKTQ